MSAEQSCQLNGEARVPAALGGRELCSAASPVHPVTSSATEIAASVAALRVMAAS